MLDSTLEAELMQRVQAIPIVSTLEMEFLEWAEGRCRARVPYRKIYDGVFESFHGGILMTVADSIACFAILTRTGAREAMATTDMNIRFLAPCLTDVTADARVVKLGRTLCPVTVDLFDTAGKQVALAQVSYMRLGPMPA